jgi:ATP-dependent Clp protease ATP-binding subunit ClpA
MEMMSLPTLVEAVRQRSADSPLDRIATALMISEELTSSADDLIGHFVADARQAGCSWTEIGHRIGVSKQAARQRFGQRLPAAGENGPERQPRLLACLAAAGRAAAADGAAEIGTHHQLIGLFQEGVAAAIMERLGVQATAVRWAGRELFPGGGLPGDVPPPESAEAREALWLAARLARRAGLSHVGTEHLLSVLALDPGSRARRVLAHLDVSIPAVEKELECYLGPERRRRRRWGKKADQQCSFCGTPAAGGVRLVAGPGVRICTDCISLASEIAAEDPAGP